jgi:hypothetical protein
MAETHRASPYPPYVDMDEAPSDDAFAVMVGPDFATNRVTVRDDGTTLTVSAPRIPVRALLAFLLVFAALVTSLPWILPRLGATLHVERSLLIAMGFLLWGLIVPSMVGVALVLDRLATRVGPGAILDKGTRDLELPWIPQTVPAERVRFVVQVSGFLKYGVQGANATVFGVVFDHEDGRRYAPIARLTTNPLGKTGIELLAKELGVPLRRLDAKAFH